MKKSVSLMIYPALVCLSKYFTSIITDFGDKIIPKGDGTFPITGDSSVRTVKYSSPDIDCTVSNDIKGSKDEQAIVKIWDRDLDTKYYRQLLDANVTVDELIETTTKISFD